MVEGRSVLMHYGTQRMWELVAKFGEEVLKIPEGCVTMHKYQKEILHVKDSWVREEHGMALLSTIHCFTSGSGAL